MKGKNKPIKTFFWYEAACNFDFHNSVISASQVICASVCANLKREKKCIPERKQIVNEVKKQEQK